ncbi:MAG TPA: hypothetical protein VMC82_00865 [Thermoplasmata archaeon]|nr:hypothetical protein [Thermoplasmata archaeon]
MASARRSGRWLVLGVLAIAALVAVGLGPASAASYAVPGSAAPAAHGSALTLNWTNLSLSSAAQPPPRNDGNMVWDSTDGYLLLFGGEYLNESTFTTTYYNDTWKFAGGAWVNLTAAGAPPARHGAGLADDPANDEVVLFGGVGAHGRDLNDTWTYAGGVWTNITSLITGASPPAGFWFSMAYDPTLSSVLLFGGINVSGGVTHEYGNDTWSFSGHTWTHLTPTVVPPGRHAQEMTWDAADDEMVMFGGLSAGPYLNDTWTFSGGTWHNDTTAVHPGARAGAGLAFDTDLDSVVLYGGEPASFDFYSTWLFLGGTWTQYNTSLVPDNPQATYGQLAYDAADTEVVDLNEPIAEGAVSTWVLTPSSSTSPPPATYPVTFNEAGLPASTTWTVTLGGTSNHSSTSSIGFTEQNDSYAFNVTPVAGYSASPSTGSLEVSGGPEVVNVTFTPGASALSVTLAVDPATVVLGNATNFTVSASGGVAPIRFAYSGLPDGCTSANEARLPCVATEAGTFPVTVTATDADGHTAEANATLTVTESSPPPGPGPTANSDTTLWIVVGVVVAIAVVLLVVALVRRKRPSAPAPGPSPSGPPAPPTPPPP